MAEPPNAPSRASRGSDGVSDQSEKCTHSLFMSPFSTLISTVHQHLRGPPPLPRPPHIAPRRLCTLFCAPFAQSKNH